MIFSVTIIIPVYNVDIYLPECLDSVLSQTRKDIEIICVNDCSPDTSREILNSYAARDNRLVILEHEHNRGLAAARNTGLASASGDYIFFLDSDDVLFSADSVAHLYEIALKDNVDEVVGATLRWNEKTGEQNLGYHKEYLQHAVSAVQFKDCPSLRHNAIACNKLLKRSFLEDNRLCFNDDLRKFEDNVFSWKAHLLARSISLTLQPTYLHRLRGEDQRKSIMQDKKLDVEYHALAARYMLDFLERNPQFSSLRHYFESYFFLWCYFDVQRAVERNPTRRQKKELLGRYLSVLARVPAYSLDESTMLGRYRIGLQLMQQGQFDEAWRAFAVQDFQAYWQHRGIDIGGNSKSRKKVDPLQQLKFIIKKILRLFHIG